MRNLDPTIVATLLCLGGLGLPPAYSQSLQAPSQLRQAPNQLLQAPSQSLQAPDQSLQAAKKPLHCDRFNIDDKASQSLASGPVQTSGCQVRKSPEGFLLPDPKCTPGAINPTLTAKVLQDPAFTTKCVRNDATSEEQKQATYAAYGIEKPQDNQGSNQTCELDHLVSLELGGADTLDNIWPQCGPSGVELKERFFKRKDLVEDHLGDFVQHGKVDLAEMQRRIAEDWTQFLDAATETCSKRKCKGHDTTVEAK